MARSGFERPVALVAALALAACSSSTTTGLHARSVYVTSMWGLSISTDGGVHFNVPTFSFTMPPEVVAVDGATVFAGADTKLYRSTTGGTSVYVP